MSSLRASPPVSGSSHSAFYRTNASDRPSGDDRAGSPRRTLIGQFIVENVVLTVLGGLAAFVLAFILLRAFDAADFMPGAHFDLNLRVFAWGMLIAAFLIWWWAWWRSSGRPCRFWKTGALGALS